MKHPLLLGVLCLILLGVLSGCETVKGIGRDITGAGETLQQGMSTHKGR